MNSVILTYRDTHIFGWHVTLEAEIFGPDAGNLNRKLQEIRNEISSKRADKLEALKEQCATLRWWQIFKKEKIDEEMRLTVEGRWSEDWLVNIHFKGGVLQEQGFEMINKTITKDDSTTITIEKWVKA